MLEWLREKGCTVDDALVEATVNELFGKVSQAFEACGRGLCGTRAQLEGRAVEMDGPGAARAFEE